MAPQTQQAPDPHLSALAESELDTANDQLTEAGRTIETLRADALALATKLGQARGEAEQAMAELTAARQELADAREEAHQQDVTRAALEEHIRRLKRQLDNPAKLMAKKALRRGHYKGPAKP